MEAKLACGSTVTRPIGSELSGPINRVNVRTAHLRRTAPEGARCPADLLEMYARPELGFAPFLATVNQYYVPALWPAYLRRCLLVMERRLGLSGRWDSA